MQWQAAARMRASNLLMPACPCHLPVDAVDCLMEHGQCSRELCVVPLPIGGTVAAATSLVVGAAYASDSIAQCSCDQKLHVAVQECITAAAKGVPCHLWCRKLERSSIRRA